MRRYDATLTDGQWEVVLTIYAAHRGAAQDWARRVALAECLTLVQVSAEVQPVSVSRRVSTLHLVACKRVAPSR